MFNLTKKIMISIAFIAFLTSCTKTYDMPNDGNFHHALPLINEIPNVPLLIIPNSIKTISFYQLELAIKSHASVSWLAEDSIYFLPTKRNMEVVIDYLDTVFQKFNIYYIPEGLDCDDFARSKTALSRIILSHAYKVEAAPAIFTIFVKQSNEWASVPAGGAHALIIYACVDENNEVKVFVWEPQTTQTISVLDYPNRDNVFYVGAERADKIVEKINK